MKRTSLIIMMLLVTAGIFGQSSKAWKVNGLVTTDGKSEINNGLLKIDSVHYNTTPARVSAYISTPAATTITDAGVYYFLKGTFSNINVSQFGADGDTLIYQNGTDRYLYISYSFTAESNAPNSVVTFAVTRNDTLMAGSDCTQLFKTAGEDYNVSSVWITHIHYNDKIKIVCKSDAAASTITATEGSTVAFQIP